MTKLVSTPKRNMDNWSSSKEKEKKVVKTS